MKTFLFSRFKVVENFVVRNENCGLKFCSGYKELFVMLFIVSELGICYNVCLIGNCVVDQKAVLWKTASKNFTDWYLSVSTQNVTFILLFGHSHPQIYHDTHRISVSQHFFHWALKRLEIFSVLKMNLFIINNRSIHLENYKNCSNHEKFYI